MPAISTSHAWPCIRKKIALRSTSAVGGVALAVCILSGSTFTTFAKLLSSSLSAASLLFVSELLTAFFVLFSFGVVPVFRAFVGVRRQDAVWLIAMAACSGVLGPLLLFSGLSFTTAINANFFGRTDILFLIVLAHVTLREAFTRAHALSLATIAIGIVTISLHGFTEGISLKIGDVLIIGSAFGYALGAIIFRGKLKHIEPHIALFARSSIALTVFFLISPFLHHPFIDEISAMPARLLPALIGFAFLSRFLNSVTYYMALDRLKVSTVTIVGTLDIVCATAFAFLLLGEAVEWYHVLGGICIITGNILFEYLGNHDNTHIHAKQLKHHIR